jgi:CBS domain-containing protein
MRFEKPVIQVMSEQPVTINSSQTLSDARALMSKHDIHHLPVVEDERLVGIISAGDLVKLSLLFDPENDDDSLNSFLDRQYTIDSVMQKHPVTIGVEGTLRDAASLLGTGGFHALPVVGYDGRLKGIVTSTDLIRLLVD